MVDLRNTLVHILPVILIKLNCCSCVNWEIFSIRNPHACEYPIKYLAFNPNDNVKKTYFMVRSTSSANCGIFEYKWADYDGPSGCTGSIICVIPGANQNALFERKSVTDSPYVDKIADFPAAMTANKYTSPMMFGCLYRMPPNNPFCQLQFTTMILQNGIDLQQLI